MDRCKKNIIFVAVILWLLAAGVHLCAATLTATIDPPTVTVGESATLNLVFEGGVPDSEVKLPVIDNLDFQFTGQSSRQIIINNRISSQYVISYAVSSQKEGEYTIPSIVATVGGQRVSSQPIKFVVGKANNSDIERFARLRLTVSRSQVRVGEPFYVEIRLLFLAMNGAEQPQIGADGFTIGKLAQNESHTIEDGRSWRLITFKTFATAIKPGELTLGPATMKVTIPARLERNFFGETVVASWRTVVLTTSAYKIKSEPLPSINVPSEFNGAIGVYNMTVNVAPTNVAVGDPITVKVTISGRGPIESLTLPEQPQWSEFKVYPPTSRVELSDQFGLAGSKIFEQVVVAKSTETRELPPFTFAYFDTDKQQYQVLKGPLVPLIVRPSAGNTVVFASTNSEPSAIQTDIVHIKTRPGAIGTISTPLITSPVFWTVQTIPAIAWFGLLLRRKRLDELANNPKLRRRLQAEKIIKEELQRLPQLAQSEKTEEFFAAVFRILQEKLGERLDLPAVSITESVIDEQLRPAGAPEELIQSLQKLFFECNQARYGGEKNVRQLNEFIPMVEKTLEMLSEIEIKNS
ncbi:MAG: BatD family protein [Verrucomicrobiia bacterium]